MTLTDQLGLLEAERDRIKAENESIKTRMAKQAGALDESRAQNRQLIMRLERVTGAYMRLKEYFHGFHGTAERIMLQHQEIAEVEKLANPPAVAEAVNVPPETPMRSLMRRLVAAKHHWTSGLVSRDGWLPPGVTDKDIDDAASDPGGEYQCDCCGRMWPAG